MSNRSYYLAHGDSEAKVLAFFERRREANNAAESLAKEVGGKGAAVGRTMAGVIFEGQPPAGWFIKGHVSDGTAYCTPHRRTKVGKELCKRMAAIRVPDAASLHSEFTSGGGHMDTNGHGITINWISAEIAKGKAIISVPSGMDFTPPETTPLKMSEYWALKE